jgi:tight adherence protein B
MEWSQAGLWVIPLLYLVSLAGLAYAALEAFRSGAESYAKTVTEDTARDFADMFFFIPPKRILELAWTCAIVGFLVFFFLAGHFRSAAGMAQGLVAGALAGAGALASPRLALAFLRRRRLIRFEAQLVDALVTMSGALKSGASILQAFEHVVREGSAPIAQDLGFFLHQVRVGVKFEDALRNLDRHVGSQELTLVVSAIEIARQTGGNLTDVFDKIAATIRERNRIQDRVRALTSQGRLQGIVVGLLPAGLALVMFTIDPAMMVNFFASPMGLLLTFLVVVLEGVGAWLIRKVTQIDV